MTTEPTIQQRLVEPFPPEEVKQRPGRGSMTFSYVDAPAVMHRLDEVVGLENWQTTFKVINLEESVVECTLMVRINGEWITKTDAGYPNSDNDDEPLKSAYSDALKRAAVQFGIGRHLREKVAPPKKAPATSIAPPEASPNRNYDPEELRALMGEYGVTKEMLIKITGASTKGNPQVSKWISMNPGKTVSDLISRAADLKSAAVAIA